VAGNGYNANRWGENAGEGRAEVLKRLEWKGEKQGVWAGKRLTQEREKRLALGFPRNGEEEKKVAAPDRGGNKVVEAKLKNRKDIGGEPDRGRERERNF